MGASSENKTAEHWGWISQKRNSICREDQQPLTVACKATWFAKNAQSIVNQKGY
jgi:hypothetical protein